MDEIVSTGIRDIDVPPINATPVEDTRTERQKYIDSLRAFADFLEAHPKLATPSTQKLYVFPNTDEMETYAREMGKCRKSADETYFNLTRDFLPSLMYEPTWYRERVCERVIVGQKEVQEDVVQVVGKRTVIQDVVEWRCPKVLERKELKEAIGE